MKSFLKKTADYLIKNYGNSLGEICIVLPNRRASMFLKKYIAAGLNKTVWSPAFYAIKDFVFELSGFRLIEPVSLQFELYEVHKEVEGENASDFDEFLNWSNVLLHDFNDVDLHLADPKVLFTYLNDVKAISLWNPDGRPLTEFQQRYLAFFNSLLKYYSLLTSRLKEKNTVYQGLAYRSLAENMDKTIETVSWEKVIFAGFNALSYSEEKILFGLETAGKANLLWDADQYYVDDKFQEAGKFLREYYATTDKKEVKWIGNHFSEEGKNIQVIGVPNLVGQAKVAGALLEQIDKDGVDIESTAVVLNDESLVMPLLNSIPENVKDFNLTMGLPLKQTPLFNLVVALFEMNENALKFDKTGGKKFHVYFKDILKIIGHPYINELLEFYNEPGVIAESTRKLRESNRIFYFTEDVEHLLNVSDKEMKQILLSMLNPWGDDIERAINAFTGLINVLQPVFAKGNEHSVNTSEQYQSVDLEYLFNFSKIFVRLKYLVEEYPFIKSSATLKSLFLQVAGSGSIPFYGEPLKGLQIMGMLETRTLDFENIIMLSVNEDLIPAGKSQNSFIPFDLRKEFNLPTYKDNNAIYAYHFYRLLQRAKNVYLLYATEADGLGGGDKSRFITQIQTELTKYNSDIKIGEQIVANKLEVGKQNEDIEIKKTKFIVEKLTDMADSGFSPTALNVYRRCPLQFYFQYILKLGETEEPEETIEARTLGKVVHEVLEIFYKPFINRNITESDVKKMIPEVEKYVTASFKEHYKDGDIEFGINHLIFKVANLFVVNFLKKEIGFLKELSGKNEQMIIRYLEKRYTALLPVRSLLFTDGKGKVLMKGTFDRVDEVNGKTRIIDYKTGMVKKNDLFLKDWEDLMTESKYDKNFQLLFYGWLFGKNNEGVGEIETGIISFRQLSAGMMCADLPNKEPVTEESLAEFEEILKSILMEILDPEVSFAQTEVADDCKYCPFTSICGR